jgi:hypothetical protein
MDARSGNQFWKNRSKHGRDKLFTTPFLLWQAAEQYFETCDENPWYEHDVAGKYLDDVYRKKMIPYTLDAFRLYVGASEHYWNEFRKSQHKALEKTPEDPIVKGFLEVIDRIETIIRTQKLIGASIGAFKPSILTEMGMASKFEVRQVDKEGNDVKPAPPALNIIVQTAAAPIAESEDE